MPLAEARHRLSELASRVETTHERIVVNRNGRPAFAISLDDIESMEETLSLLSDPEALEGIRESQRELSAGRGIAVTKDVLISILARRAD